VRIAVSILAAALALDGASADTPEKVSVCALRSNPASYDHKLIEVSGVVSHEFEQFIIDDSRCVESELVHVWLEYGGKTSSGTIYCCPGSGVRTRPEPAVVEGIAIPLIEDAPFKRFDARIQGKKRVSFRATLIGRFFAGNRERFENAKLWPGYGHFGCCTLLLIPQVLAAGVVSMTAGDER